MRARCSSGLVLLRRTQLKQNAKDMLPFSLCFCDASNRPAFHAASSSVFARSRASIGSLHSCWLCTRTLSLPKEAACQGTMKLLHWCAAKCSPALFKTVHWQLFLVSTLSTRGIAVPGFRSEGRTRVMSQTAGGFAVEPFLLFFVLTGPGRRVQQASQQNGWQGLAPSACCAFSPSGGPPKQAAPHPPWRSS